MGGVTPTKGDFLVGERDQSVIGDGYAMSVTAQITEYILGASEGSLQPLGVFAIGFEKLVEPMGL